MKFKCVIEYEYPVEHKPPVKAEIVLHGDRVTTDKIVSYKERPHENWEYLKEHITEMRDADGELNQKDTCKFILNLMGVIEREGEAE